MSPLQDIVKTIGNTPLLRLRGVSAATGCDIFGKAEFLNPGGSVKDRAALGIIQEAERSGHLRPGGTIVEGTVGNTGIGLALIGNTLGYRTVVVMPEGQSRAKLELLHLYGVDVRLVPAKPYWDPDNFIHLAERLAAELNEQLPNGAIWANQFDNLANSRSHYHCTGPEIWQQSRGTVDAFICAVGTGGTLAGVSRYLREQNPHLICGVADPMGGSLFNYYKYGEFRSEGDSITEGIGQVRLTRNLQGVQVDEAFQVTDREALPYVFDLLRHEGLCLGGSSAINVAGAVRMAQLLGPGHTIVTILCDHGSRYQDRLYNPTFLRDRGLPTPEWLHQMHARHG